MGSILGGGAAARLGAGYQYNQFHHRRSLSYGDQRPSILEERLSKFKMPYQCTVLLRAISCLTDPLSFMIMSSLSGFNIIISTRKSETLKFDDPFRDQAPYLDYILSSSKAEPVQAYHA